jgi:glycosyltransferase involved in cell wall biosynthesis
MKEYKLSIITINLNNKSGLEKTIQSVASQTYTDFEYIVIDGNSTDGSLDIIKQYEQKINYWISEKDKGIYNAMNKGILKSNGEYCLFLNSGDYLGDYNVLLNIFNISFNEDFVVGSIILDGKDKPEKREIPDDKSLTFRHFMYLALPHQGTFIKRSLFHKLGLYKEGIELSSDWEFFLVAILKYGATLKKIPEIVSIYDLDGISSLPENVTVIQNERREILQRHFPRFLPDYEYLEKLESTNRQLEYKIQHSFWILITKILKKIKNQIILL